MRDRVKQVDLLDSALDWAEAQCVSTENCPDCAGFDIAKAGKNCGLALAVDYLMANGFIAQQWIPVAERLPDEPMEYIVMIKGDASATTLLFDGQLWFQEDEEGWRTYYAVTHWVPLPEPPKEVSDEC